MFFSTLFILLLKNHSNKIAEQPSWELTKFSGVPSNAKGVVSSAYPAVFSQKF